MPHFPGWFVAICVLLPVSNVIYKYGRTIRKIVIKEPDTQSQSR